MMIVIGWEENLFSEEIAKYFETDLKIKIKI